jgi:single-stranded-DNA-specific exonuclease
VSTPAEAIAAGPFEAQPYSYADVRAVAAALDLAEPVATALVRRGHRTVEQAREFLSGEESHPSAAFEGIDRAVEMIRAAIAAGTRITVHGDYDVDGMSATAILVSALRRAGADCDWLIPDRSADGYGISSATVARLAERGTGLMISADCGIACPDEVAEAQKLGIEVIVTDHHQPAERLPDCPIVHPEISSYPFPSLCGAAVAHKLACRLEGDDDEVRDLDLVALATIADMVPLVGENRTLARRGIAELRRARRPGIRALLAVAEVDPEVLDEGDLGFRISPRLNAAGRLYRADAGVELMLTGDDARATEIARELDSANHERREVERGVLHEAEAAYRELPDEAREAPALVLAGEGWHPGVVGIVASRIVERFGRPAVLLSIGPDGRAKGSARSIPGFDLLEGLRACSEHLERFGGHRAAAGLELEAERIDSFRAAFASHAAEVIETAPGEVPERIDVIVGAEALDFRTAEQLAALGPFGQGNPEIRLLVPWARVGEVRPMGQEGKHARFDLRSGAGAAAGVAFNSNAKLAAAQRAPHDLIVRLELNHWNGAIEPRAVLASATAGAAPPEDGERRHAACGCAPEADSVWWQRFEEELRGEPARWPTEFAGGDPEPAPGRTRLTHRRRSAIPLIAELLSSGCRVAVVCADARRRAELALLAASPARFGGAHAVVCGSCPPGTLGAAVAPSGAELLLTDWEALAAEPGALAAFEHVVAVDPPPLPALAAAISSGSPDGFLHESWWAAGELPSLCWGERWQPRAALAEVFRGAVEGPLEGEALAAVLCGSAALRRHPAIAARCVRVLAELELAELGGEVGQRRLRIVSSARTELERSDSWRQYSELHRRGAEHLQERLAPAA